MSNIRGETVRLSRVIFRVIFDISELILGFRRSLMQGDRRPRRRPASGRARRRTRRRVLFSVSFRVKDPMRKVKKYFDSSDVVNLPGWAVIKFSKNSMFFFDFSIFRFFLNFHRGDPLKKVKKKFFQNFSKNIIFFGFIRCS